jgi:amino acid transporter
MTEETKNPGRDVPLGLISFMLVITLVYCAIPPGARGDAAVQRH